MSSHSHCGGRSEMRLARDFGVAAHTVCNGAGLGLQEGDDGNRVGACPGKREGAASESAEPPPPATRHGDDEVRQVREPGRSAAARARSALPLRNWPERRLSRNTVKDCLHKHARQPDHPSRTVSHGCYHIV
jgi:hypothetical protein